MDLTQALIAIIGFLSTALFGGYGLFRLLHKIQDNSAQQKATEGQIALTRETADAEAVRSLHTSVNSLIDLFRQQMVQQAQSTIQNAQIEADKVTAQNNLAGAIRDAAGNTEGVLRAYRSDIDLFVAQSRRDINTLDAGFRTISDGFIFMNSQLTRVLEKMDNTIDAMNAIVVRIHKDTMSMRNTYTHGQENLEDVLDLVTDMHNTVVRLTRDEATAEKMIIRPYESGRLRVPLNEWLATLPKGSDNQASAAVTQPLPDVDFIDDPPQDEADSPDSTSANPASPDSTNVNPTSAADVAAEGTNP